MHLGESAFIPIGLSSLARASPAGDFFEHGRPAAMRFRQIPLERDHAVIAGKRLVEAAGIEQSVGAIEMRHRKSASSAIALS